MAHRHVTGEIVNQYFVAIAQRDPIEGRGGVKDAGIFTDHMDAYNAARGLGVQGEDGDVHLRFFRRCKECPEIFVHDEAIYIGSGYFKRNKAGKHGIYANYMQDGWRNDYSPIAQDPEYAEYVRLRKKFYKE